MLPRISITAVSKRARSPCDTSSWSAHSRSSTAWTRSSISVVAGPESSRRPGERSPSSLIEGSLDRLAGAEHLVEVGQREDRLHRPGGPGDPEVAAGLAGGLQAGDQRPQAG